ncbi:tachylectin-2-like isoform X2 [Pelobates fuscus]|uniref:tachylectin-2-like isoform X2 n=1 Tax=Pelobates fuscus TaxID=191477 RepID=UPI002FE4C3A9
MDTPDTLLFAVKDYNARVGLPPKDRLDGFDARCKIVGKLNNVSKIAFNPEGVLFAVRGIELFTGAMPSDPNLDWFSTAKRVGKTNWDGFKFLFFDPKGILYAVTKNGEFYKGPAPSNENVSWLYGQATKIGTGSWNEFDALFFDPKGILYAVTNDDKLVMRSPPTKPDDNWLDSSTTIGKGGWRILTHFMAFSPEFDLWCVDSKNGNIYKGRAPTVDNTNYMNTAQNLGWGYNVYPLLSFTIDKTIQSIVSFEFLPASGKIISQGTEVVQSQIYVNKSSTPLKHTFSFSKTMTESSTFSQEHGFTVAIGAEMGFKAGVPLIGETEFKISINVSTTHTWTFTKTNETQTTFSSSSDVEVPGGHSIRMVASVTKGEMDVPYRAKIRTLFGYESYIEGLWKGVTHYNLMVSQEDYKP